MATKKILLLFVCTLTWAAAGTRVERIRNEKVIAYEETLGPGETEAPTGNLPSVTVFSTDGTVEVEIAPGTGKTMTMPVKRGQVISRDPGSGPLKSVGVGELHFFRIEFVGKGTDETWGPAGFAPDYRMLVEDGLARVYNIRIAAGVSEPQHTHRNRVVVCLSGAQLRHVLPDGHEEDSTIKTGDCLWRLGQTHVGKNIGSTDLWVIAVEPK